MDKSIDRKSIQNLRFYKSPKGSIVFVNGFCFNMITKSTDVIYTNGKEGIVMTLPVNKFEDNFKLIE